MRIEKLDSVDHSILRSIYNYTEQKEKAPKVTDIVGSVYKDTGIKSPTIYGRVNKLKKMFYIIKNKPLQGKGLYLSILGTKTAQEVFDSPVATVEPINKCVAEDAERPEPTKEEKLSFIYGWLYVNDGAYKTKQEWRNALLKMLKTTI